jgi:hypothetical protein
VLSRYGPYNMYVCIGTENNTTIASRAHRRTVAPGVPDVCVCVCNACACARQGSAHTKTIVNRTHARQNQSPYTCPGEKWASFIGWVRHSRRRVSRLTRRL